MLNAYKGYIKDLRAPREAIESLVIYCSDQDVMSGRHATRNFHFVFMRGVSKPRDHPSYPSLTQVK